MADVELDIGVNTSQAEKGLKQFGQQGQKAAKSISTSFVGLGTAIAGAVAGFASFAVLRDVTELASAQQDAINRLNTSLKSAGTFSEEASQQFQEFASGLQAVSTVGDETTLELAALARNFTGTNEEAIKLTQAAVELGKATGQDLQTSVEQLGRTFSGSLGRLGQTVPILGTLSKESLAAGGALDLVLERFGGTAQAELATFTGATTQLSNTFGDFREELGFVVIENEALILAINKINEVFAELGSTVKENRSFLSDFVTSGIKLLVDGVGIGAQVVQGFVDGFFAVIAAIKATNIAFAEIQIAIRDIFFQNLSEGFRAFFEFVLGGFRSFVVGITDILSEIPGFDNLFPDASSFVDKELGAIQTSFDKFGQSISVAGEEGNASLRKFIEEQANVITANEESRQSFQDITDAVTQGAADLSVAIDNIGSDTAKSTKQAGDSIKNNVGKPLKEAAKDGEKAKETIKSFLADVERQAEPLETQLQETGLALSKAFETDDVETFKKEFATLQKLQADYAKQVEETAKKQEQAAQRQADAIKKLQKETIAAQQVQAQATQQTATAIAGSIIGGIDGSINVAEIQNEIDALKGSLNSAALSGEARADALEEIAKKEEQIAAARESQFEKTAGIVSQVGGLVVDSIFPGLGGIAGELLQTLSAGPEEIRAFFEGFAQALPDVIVAIADAAPEIVLAIAENADKIVEALVVAGPRLAIALVRRAPDIIKAIVRQTFQIPAAIVRGIAKQVFKLNFDEKELGKKFAEAGQAVVDAVLSIPEQLAEGVGQLVESIGLAGQNFVTNILSGAGQFVQKLLDELGLGGGSGEGGGIGGVSNRRILTGIATGGLSEVARATGVNLPGFGLAGGRGGISGGFVDSQDRQAFVNSITEGVTSAILQSDRDQTSRPLVIQLEVGQAQLANVLLQLNRNGFRTV